MEIFYKPGGVPYEVGEILGTKGFSQASLRLIAKLKVQKSFLSGRNSRENSR